MTATPKLFIFPPIMTIDDFNENRLLAKSMAAWEEQCHYTKSLLCEALKRVHTIRQKAIFAKWETITINAKIERSAKENEASKYGQRLLLRRSIHCWKSGAMICKQDREMERLIALKWKEVNQWLGNQ